MDHTASLIQPLGSFLPGGTVSRSWEKHINVVLFFLQWQLVVWFCCFSFLTANGALPDDLQQGVLLVVDYALAPSLATGEAQWNPSWFALVGMESPPCVRWVQRTPLLGLGFRHKQAWWDWKPKNHPRRSYSHWLPLPVFHLPPRGLWWPFYSQGAGAGEGHGVISIALFLAAVVISSIMSSLRSLLDPAGKVLGITAREYRHCAIPGAPPEISATYFWAKPTLCTSNLCRQARARASTISAVKLKYPF